MHVRVWRWSLRAYTLETVEECKRGEVSLEEVDVVNCDSVFIRCDVVDFS